jgi:stress-induced-phosphoprotein 1
LVAAHDAYEEGLKIDANNAQLKSGLKSVQSAMEYEASTLPLLCREFNL